MFLIFSGLLKLLMDYLIYSNQKLPRYRIPDWNFAFEMSELPPYYFSKIKYLFFLFSNFCNFKSAKMTGVELEDILSELFPSDDPLDQKDFDVNQYINSLFPNEQSLNGLEDVILEMTNRIDDLDGEVSNLVREGNQNSFESENLLNQSMEEIKELVKSINTIKTRAQVGFPSFLTLEI